MTLPTDTQAEMTEEARYDVYFNRMGKISSLSDDAIAEHFVTMSQDPEWFLGDCEFTLEGGWKKVPLKYAVRLFLRELSERIYNTRDDWKEVERLRSSKKIAAVASLLKNDPRIRRGE